MDLDPQDETEKEFQDMMFDVKYDKEQFEDSATIGLMMYRLAKQRKKTNHLFKEISEKLEEMNRKLENTGNVKSGNDKALMNRQNLSEVDKKVYDYVKKQDKVDAADVKEHLGYKGRNAASARLNSLYKKGILNKERVGKRVLYWAKG